MPAPTAKRPTAFKPFAGRDLPWLLDAQASSRGGRPFIIWEPFQAEPQRFTCAEFNETDQGE